MPDTVRDDVAAAGRWDIDPLLVMPAVFLGGWAAVLVFAGRHVQPLLLWGAGTLALWGAMQPAFRWLGRWLRERGD